MKRSKLETLTRLGFAARGVMYLLIGIPAIRTGRAQDGQGALEMLGGGAGRLLLGLMASGFAAYALWRLADSWLDSEGHGSDAKGWAKRLGGAVSGIVHLGLAVIAGGLALGNRASGQSSDSTRQGAATALDLPGGWVLVLIGAAGLIAVGIYQLLNAYGASFLRRLDGKAAASVMVRTAGRIGYAARGIVFLVMGGFLLQAGLAGRAREAGGMGEALESMPPTIKILVGAGLALFGLFSFVEARHRRLQVPEASLVR